MNLPQNSIRILGAYGSKYKDLNSTCLQITDKILIDAGSILKPLREKAKDIEHIFLTHSHFDHIADLPFLIDTFFEKRKATLNIYATKQTINILKQHIFNNDIWPDFTKIKLLNQIISLKLHSIDLNKNITIDNIKIKALKNNHLNGSCGYIFTKNKNTFLFTSDTYICNTIIDEINTNKGIKNLIIEVSFPSKDKELAKTTKHLTPELLKIFLKKITRKINVYINHLKPTYKSTIYKEIKELNIKATILDDCDLICF